MVATSAAQMDPKHEHGYRQRFVYVQTFGCQMNIYDTDRMVQVLGPHGYEPTDSPAQADLIVLNTCSVREKAEHKMMSALGRFARLKEYNDELVLGVGGCVATQEGEKLLKKVPYLDFVFGPDNIAELPDLVTRARGEGTRTAEVDFLDRKKYDWIPLEGALGGQVSAMLTVMKGCNKFCSFCIVPFTRGREVSKPPDLIVEETKRLVDSGVREVMLLGQNVNSYGRDINRGKGPRFADLLAMVNEVDGLERIRFTTSHPWDCTDALVDAFDGRLGKLCEYFHLPVQCGSDTVLKKMRRGYTIESYLERMGRLREVAPDLALSTDIIVGFPGETDAQFRETVELLETVRFDRIFSFSYSERPGTAASRLKDDISREEKKARLAEVQAVQGRITAEIMAERYTDSVQQVLIEGDSRNTALARRNGVATTPQLTGRNRHNVVVNFPVTAGTLGGVGRLVDVAIEAVNPHSLFGSVVE